MLEYFLYAAEHDAFWRELDLYFGGQLHGADFDYQQQWDSALDIERPECSHRQSLDRCGHHGRGRQHDNHGERGCRRFLLRRNNFLYAHRELSDDGGTYCRRRVSVWDRYGGPFGHSWLGRHNLQLVHRAKRWLGHPYRYCLHHTFVEFDHHLLCRHPRRGQRMREQHAHTCDRHHL